MMQRTVGACPFSCENSPQEKGQKRPNSLTEKRSAAADHGVVQNSQKQKQYFWNLVPAPEGLQRHVSPGLQNYGKGHARVQGFFCETFVIDQFVVISRSKVFRTKFHQNLMSSLPRPGAVMALAQEANPAPHAFYGSITENNFGGSYQFCLNKIR